MSSPSGCHNYFRVKQALLFLHCKMWIRQLILSEVTSGSITVCCLVQKAIHRFYCRHNSCHDEDKYLSVHFTLFLTYLTNQLSLGLHAQ